MASWQTRSVFATVGLFHRLFRSTPEERAGLDVAPVGPGLTDDPNDPDLRRPRDGEKVPSGQHAKYIVLSAEERAKGFVEPVRRSYVHVRCGSVTTMGQAIAETYARKPEFYGRTFCARCGDHYPVGEDGEFLWNATDQKVGTRRAECQMPPEGWRCTRQPGHDGPCAAYET